MHPRITYWTGVWHPTREAVSKEVDLLRHRYGRRAPVVSFAAGQPFELRHGSGVIRLNGSQHRLLHLLAATVERWGQLTHAFGSVSEWHLLRVLGRRPMVYTLALPGPTLSAALYDKVSIFAAESQALADTLIKSGVSSSRVELVYPGVDLKAFVTVPPPAAGRFRVLFASTPAHVEEFDRRGIPQMIEAARLVPDVDLVLLWRNWGDTDEARRALAALDPPANVVIDVRDAADMIPEYQGAHATICCYADGFGKSCPNSVVEGLACGRPAILSASVGTAALVGGRGAGVVVPRTADGIAAGIRELQKDPGGFGSRARALAEAEFSLDTFVARYDDLYRRVLGKGRVRPVERIPGSAPLNIRVLAGHLGPGAGSHVYNRELILRLAARGHHVSAVCFDGAGAVAPVVDVVEIGFKGYANRSVIWPLTTWLEHRHMTREFRRREWAPVDAVIGAEHLFIKGHVERFPTTPLVYLPHSLVVAHEIEGYRLPHHMERVTMSVYDKAQAWALQHADATVRFTQKAVDTLARACPDVRARRFVVNPLGVDIPADPRTVPDPGPRRLLYVGRLAPQKRVGMILTALAGIPDLDWTFDIVGDGPSRDALTQQAEALGIASRVHFHGFQVDTAPWYRKADLLLLASKSESFGLVLVEAMSFAVPCLSFFDNGTTVFNPNREIIDNGRTGILVDSEEEFRAAIADAIRDPDRLTAMGKAAREEMMVHRTWEAHLDRFEALLRELVAGTNGPGEARQT